MKKIIIITVLTVLAFTAVVTLRPDNSRRPADTSLTGPPPPASSEQQNVEKDTVPTVTTVKYGENGFEPKEITIKQGTTVQFVNNTQIPMYVATDPHPEHTNYPEFEMGVVMQRPPRPGENFNFKFDRIGNWTFHNHAQPEHTGRVIVE